MRSVNKRSVLPPLTMATKLVQRYQEGARNISHSKSGSEGYSSLTDNEEWQPYAIYEKTVSSRSVLGWRH